MKANVPARLLACASFIVVAFACCHVAGLRESTTFLCRIDIASQPSGRELFALGLYLASYLGLVLVAPILAMAAALHAAWTNAATFLERRKNPAAAGMTRA